MDPWLPLTDYSIKYRVSVSTLRRRIKAEDLQYKFVDGRYYIIDEPLSAHQREHRPSQDHAASLMGAPLSSQFSRGQRDSACQLALASGDNVAIGSRSRSDSPRYPDFISSGAASGPLTQQIVVKETKVDEPLLATANAVLVELKKAFTQILQEKEHQIILLKTETSDLRTLVKVLENENERLRAHFVGTQVNNKHT